MWLFYRKHYQGSTNWLLDKLILLGIVGKGGLDVSRHLWRYGRRAPAREDSRPVAGKRSAAGPALAVADAGAAAIADPVTNTAASAVAGAEAGRTSRDATEHL